MARRRSTRKRKRFEAPSIPVLWPGTRRQSARASSSARGRGTAGSAQKGKRSGHGWLRKLTARWGFSHYMAGLFAVMGIIGLFILFTNPHFAIVAPQVEGLQTLDAAQVLRTAHLDRANIFTLDVDQVAARVQLLPRVKRARVRLGLPNRAVIFIIERDPVLLYVREGELWGVDEEGHLFPLGDDIRTDLPALLDDDASASDGHTMDARLVQAVVQLHQKAPDLKEFRYRREYGLYFLSPEGWRVYLGDAQQMEAKLARWETIHRQLLRQKRPVQDVDLRSRHIYVR